MDIFDNNDNHHQVSREARPLLPHSDDDSSNCLYISSDDTPVTAGYGTFSDHGCADPPVSAAMMASRVDDCGEDDDRATSCGCCGLLSYSYAELRRPCNVGGDFVMNYPGDKQAFWAWPLFGPLVFPNESSDARDHCANERTFLSYLRLSVYMAIVAVAIVLSFHLKEEPSQLELRMARPLGIIFWLLAFACLLMGLGNYVQTVNKYSRKMAIVQTGWRTQSIISLISLTIVGTSLVLLVVGKLEGTQ